MRGWNGDEDEGGGGGDGLGWTGHEVDEGVEIGVTLGVPSPGQGVGSREGRIKRTESHWNGHGAETPGSGSNGKVEKASQRRQSMNVEIAKAQLVGARPVKKRPVG